MRVFSTLLAATVLAGAAPAARAQDLGQLTATFAAGAEAFGQSLGEAMTSGSSLFVTATGRAELPAPLTDAYLINIEGRSTSAVEASRLRDERLKTAQDTAKRFGVGVEIGATSFSREVDTAAMNRHRAQVTAQRAAEHAANPTALAPLYVPEDADAYRVFVARTGVRFRAVLPASLPPFLDALQKAGIDNLAGGLIQPTPSLFGQANQVLGFGSLETIDPAIWDRASQNAIAEARRQATVLAGASNRRLGEVKQVLVLTRSLQGSSASVTVAVRYGFAP